VPKTRLVFYQECQGHAPVYSWLRDLQTRDPKGWASCIAKIELLEEFGYELRRPAVDTLRDGVYELRAKHQSVQYRILYFFHGQNIAILAHAVVKKGSAVDPSQIEKAIERKLKFKLNPASHTFTQEIEDNG